MHISITLAVLMLVTGASYILWSGLWAHLLTEFTRSRHPGATGMLGGLVSLMLGLLIVLADSPDQGLLVITEIVGWICIAKGTMWMLLPGVMLSLIPRGRSAITGWIITSGILLLVAGGLLTRGVMTSTPAPVSSAAEAPEAGP